MTYRMRFIDLEKGPGRSIMIVIVSGGKMRSGEV